MIKYYKRKRVREKWKFIRKYDDDGVKRVVLKNTVDGDEWDMIESLFNVRWREIKG